MNPSFIHTASFLGYLLLNILENLFLTVCRIWTQTLSQAAIRTNMFTRFGRIETNGPFFAYNFDDLADPDDPDFTNAAITAPAPLG